jgi:YVTN family beta-propeller protein
VYCANNGGGSVTVIDGASNQVLRTISVGSQPDAFCYNPAENRVYVANYLSSSVSVLRDSAGGIEESRRPRVLSSKLEPTVLRGTLWLSSDSNSVSTSTLTLTYLLDIAGRRVLDLHPGANDVSRLPAGVYLIENKLTGSNHGPQAVRKVVLTR